MPPVTLARYLSSKFHVGRKLGFIYWWKPSTWSSAGHQRGTHWTNLLRMETKKARPWCCQGIKRKSEWMPLTISQQVYFLHPWTKGVLQCNCGRLRFSRQSMDKCLCLVPDGKSRVMTRAFLLCRCSWEQPLWTFRSVCISVEGEDTGDRWLHLPSQAFLYLFSWEEEKYHPPCPQSSHTKNRMAQARLARLRHRVSSVLGF